MCLVVLTLRHLSLEILFGALDLIHTAPREIWQLNSRVSQIIGNVLRVVVALGPSAVGHCVMLGMRGIHEVGDCGQPYFLGFGIPRQNLRESLARRAGPV